MVDSIYRDGGRYDLLFAGDGGATRFWTAQLLRSGGPALELACGTGKYLLPVAAAGVDIVGLDRSIPMLAEARRKSAALNLRIKLVAADMRAFRLRSKFRSVLIAGNSLCHLLTNADLESCLSSVRNHLDPGSFLLIDVFVPDVRLLSRDSRARFPFAHFRDPVDGGEVSVEYSHFYDPATQINHVTTFTRRPAAPPGLNARPPMSEEAGTLTMRMYFPQELEALLRHSGFEILQKFGGYGEEPFRADSQKQLIIAG